jgi:hypothetical protein
MTEVVRITSMKRFNPADREAVWGRAVTSFNMSGALITRSDATAGVLRSEVQPSYTPCSNSRHLPARATPAGVCRENQLSQLTLTGDGVAFLRMNRAIQGVGYLSTSSLLSDEERGAMQRECDNLLGFIVGESKEVPKTNARSEAGGNVDAI